jgi:hypothetical protein
VQGNREKGFQIRAESDTMPPNIPMNVHDMDNRPLIFNLHTRTTKISQVRSKPLETLDKLLLMIGIVVESWLGHFYPEHLRGCRFSKIGDNQRLAQRETESAAFG